MKTKSINGQCEITNNNFLVHGPLYGLGIRSFRADVSFFPVKLHYFKIGRPMLAKKFRDFFSGKNFYAGKKF